MAIDWVNGLLIPVIETAIIGGVALVILYYVGKGFWKAWSRSLKFALRYTIGRKQYPEESVKWVLSCIDNGIGWYDAKKTLLIKMMPEDKINETMWIYDKIINQLNKEKGGVKYGRGLKVGDSKTKSTTDFPTI